MKQDRSIKNAPDTGGKDRKKCNACLKVKSFDAFYFRKSRNRHDSICNACNRIKSNMRRESENYKQWISNYLSREDIKEKKRKINRKYKENHPNRQRDYRSTIHARMIQNCNAARYRLKAAIERNAKPCFINRIQKTIDGYNAEIKRLEREYNHPKRNSKWKSKPK